MLKSYGQAQFCGQEVTRPRMKKFLIYSYYNVV